MKKYLEKLKNISDLKKKRLVELLSLMVTIAIVVLYIFLRSLEPKDNRPQEGVGFFEGVGDIVSSGIDDFKEENEQRPRVSQSEDTQQDLTTEEI